MYHNCVPRGHSFFLYCHVVDEAIETIGRRFYDRLKEISLFIYILNIFYSFLLYTMKNSQNTNPTDVSKMGIIFGASDHEEREAREVARKAWFAFIATATAEDRASWEDRKVHAGNAGFATGYEIDEWTDKNAEAVIIFENNLNAAKELLVVLNADHHNPDDAWYGKPASEYFEWSSLGQMMNYLKIEPSKQQRMVAAWDHCPADAYAWSCPWIDVDEFTEFRLQNKIEFYSGIEKFTYKADIESLQEIIQKAKDVLTSSEVNEKWIVDLRWKGMIDELPEAALMTGKAYMTSIPDTDRERNPTGNTKVLIWWHTTPEMIEEFMERGNQQNNVVSVYGNPIRWFAWVILKP